MEAILFKSDLLKHKKSLKIVKLDKKIAQNASLTLTISDKLSVVGIGFQQDLECHAQEWGTIIVRYLTWLRLIETLRFAQDEEIQLSAENGKIKLGTMEISDSNIHVTRRDKIPLEFPFNVTPLDIINFVSMHGLERIKATGLWNTVLEVIKIIRKDLLQAYDPLKQYGVRPLDLIKIIEHRMGLKENDHDLFIQLLQEAEDLDR